MKERQVMERNLARLLKQVDYKSCGSDVEQEVQGSPVNPFRKRVFQKKLRKSSVASENINPNYSLANLSYAEESEDTQIMQSIQLGHKLLGEFQNLAIGQNGGVTKSKNQNQKQACRSVLKQLEVTVQTLANLIGKPSKQSNIKPSLKQNSSMTLIQTYQCQPQYQYQTVGSQVHRSNGKQGQKQTKIRTNANMSGSMVTTNKQQKTSKSIYQSVLEQRRARKIKNSRMV